MLGAKTSKELFSDVQNEINYTNWFSLLKAFYEPQSNYFEICSCYCVNSSSFLLLNNVPGLVRLTMFSSIHLLMFSENIYNFFLYSHMFPFLLVNRSRMTGSQSMYMFNCLRNWQFHKMIEQFYLPTWDLWDFLFLHFLTNNLFHFSHL